MKKIFSIVLLFISFGVYSQTKLIAPVVRNNPADTSYPTHIDSLGKGGFMTLSDTISRNNLPFASRKKGMIVVVKDTVTYQLVGGLDNSKWVRVYFTYNGPVFGNFVDSVRFPPGFICVWFNGLSDCYPIGKFYDSSHLNSDSTYLRYFNKGNLVDSSWNVKSPIFAGANFNIKDTSVTVSGNPVRGYIFSATGGAGGRLDTAYITPDSAYLVLQYFSGRKDSLQWTGSGGSGSGITALTGDVSAAGSGSVAATLATVNSNIGTFNNPTITVNGKGLITSIVNGVQTSDTFNYFVIDSLNTPPVSPSVGDAYQVGTSPTGAWAGNPNKIATWNGASWVFVAPTTGEYLLKASNGVISKYSGTAWVWVGKAVLHNGGETYALSAIFGTAVAQSAIVRSNGVNRATWSPTGVLTLNNLTGTGNAIFGISSAGVASRVVVVDSIWRVLGKDSILYSIGGRQRSIKDSGTTYTVAAPITLTGNIIGADTSTATTGLTTKYQNGLNWSINGNANTAATTHFIGTTNNQDLIFKRNSAIMASLGSVGVFIDSTYYGRGTGKGFNKSSLAIGDSALGRNTTGINNTALGDSSLARNTTGSGNTAGGYSAMLSNTTGGSNTAYGKGALMNNITGSSNTAIGIDALKNSTGTSDNTGVGLQALLSTTSGIDNTAVGMNAVALNTTGSYNVGLGKWSLLFNTTGSNNIGIGFNSNGVNQTGNNNIAIGSSSLVFNTNSNNTAIGFEAMDSTTSGNNNTGIGASVMHNNTTGSNNLGMGAGALYFNTTGNKNIAFGQAAGAYAPNGITQITTADSSIFIGGSSHPAGNAQNNQIVIAPSGIGLGSNTTVIGNSNTIGTAILGPVKIVSTTGSLPDPSAQLDVVSTTKGVLYPRMTTSQKNAIVSPAEGLVVYDLTLHKLALFTGTVWEVVQSL